MASLDAKVTVDHEFGGTVSSADGFSVTFLMDDSFKSWWSIARWNVHGRHWRVLFSRNVPDLFRKVLWRP